MSSDPLLILADDIITGTKKFNFYSADPALQVNGVKSLELFSGTTSDQMTIPAYSIGVVEN